jgi:hypothetical protein
LDCFGCLDDFDFMDSVVSVIGYSAGLDGHRMLCLASEPHGAVGQGNIHPSRMISGSAPGLFLWIDVLQLDGKFGSVWTLLCLRFHGSDSVVC